MAKKLPDIKKRNNGYFEMKITVAPNVRKSVYGASEAEVRRKARELKTEAARFDISNVKKMTVESYMTSWLEDVKKPSVKPGSYDRIEQSLKYQIFPYIGKLQINAVTSKDIQNMINSILKEKSYSTAKKAYNNINSCFELGVQRGEILKNPVKGAKLPPAKSTSQTAVINYEPDEVTAIIEEATRTFSNGVPFYRYGYVIVLLLNTGMREGEPLALRWSDIDFEKKRLHVHGDVVEVKNRDEGAKSKYKILEQETPKTSKSNRYIPLNKNAIDALEHIRTIVKNEDRVIATKNGTLVSPRKIYTTMEGIIDRCGLKDKVHLVHALRHTFATQLIRNGTDIKVVSEILGHEDVSTTVTTSKGHTISYLC